MVSKARRNQRKQDQMTVALSVRVAPSGGRWGKEGEWGQRASLNCVRVSV